LKIEQILDPWSKFWSPLYLLSQILSNGCTSLGSVDRLTQVHPFPPIWLITFIWVPKLFPWPIVQPHIWLSIHHMSPWSDPLGVSYAQGGLSCTTWFFLSSGWIKCHVCWSIQPMAFINLLFWWSSHCFTQWSAQLLPMFCQFHILTCVLSILWLNSFLATMHA